MDMRCSDCIKKDGRTYDEIFDEEEIRMREKGFDGISDMMIKCEHSNDSWHFISDEYVKKHSKLFDEYDKDELVPCGINKDTNWEFMHIENSD